jgi:gluconate 2-dehydrogenase gamma chain
MPLSRREILATAFGIASLPELDAALQHAHQAGVAGAGFEALPADLAVEVEALASQILPSHDGPGAKEAGVIYFIDRALHTFDAGKKDLYLRGMEEVARTRKRLFPKSATIAGLSEAGQLELVRAIETTPFFEVLRTHTMLGFLGSPEYGGNRGGVGWAYIGFEDRMSFQPPFGYYDAEAAKGKP